MTQNLHWTAGLHHDGSALYVSNPLPKLGEVVTIRLRTPAKAPIRSIFLRTAPDGENYLERMGIVEQGERWVIYAARMPVKMPHNTYRFKILSDEGAYYLTGLGVSRADGPDYYDFKLLADYEAPEWLADAVFYQIFPDRFENGDPSNDVPEGLWARDGVGTQRRPWGAPLMMWQEARNRDFYGGDLNGITQRLDYLRDLGANAIYLTPIFVSESNHRYDIKDFDNVDPYLGGNEALAALRQALDGFGMRLMLDVTLNHCGFHHPWFAEAQQDAQALTAEYFTFYNHPQNYEAWLGVRSLVKLNYRSQKLRDVMFRAPDSVLRRWLKEPYRIDAWRLDVQNMQGRQGTIQLGHKMGRELRRAVKGDNAQAYIIGEHWYDATPHLQGNELDATMNYQGFTVPVWRWLAGADQGLHWHDVAEYADRTLYAGEALAEQWTRYRAAVPWTIARHQFNLLGSHDTARILHQCNGDKMLVKLGAALLMTYPGVPCVYYGDEIGMNGGHDPLNRECMIWDDSRWDKDLRGHFQKLIALRKTAPALIEGGFQQLYADGGLIGYQRESAQQRLLVVGYRGPEPLGEIHVPVWHGGVEDGALLTDLLSGTTLTVENGMLHLVGLARGTAMILEAR
ncbi:MAG: alpha-amylase family glycosyl hydrolase [Anaerolineae bacterium]